MIGRWGRAARALSARPKRVLDLGCAFGFGTSGLPGEFVVGLDRSDRYLIEGHRRYPRLPLVLGDAEALPFADASFDAVVALDVIEHLADLELTLKEISRVLEPGGTLVLSVPNRGLLQHWDSLNRYNELRRHRPTLPPLDETEQSAIEHRHFTPRDIGDLVGESFVIQQVTYSGVGWPELVNLLLLTVCLGLARSSRLYRWLRYIYFTAYLVDDLFSIGSGSYHLMLTAQRAQIAPSSVESRQAGTAG